MFVGKKKGREKSAGPSAVAAFEALDQNTRFFTGVGAVTNDLSFAMRTMINQRQKIYLAKVLPIRLDVLDLME